MSSSPSDTRSRLATVVRTLGEAAGPLTVQQIVAACECAEVTVRRHLRRLVAEGKVERAERVRAVHVGLRGRTPDRFRLPN